MARRTRLIVNLIILALFLLSIALSHSLPWVKYIWSWGILALLVAFSLNYICGIFVHRNPTASSYPRWFLKFAMDEDDDKGRDSLP